MEDKPSRELRRLARYCGVTLDFWNAQGVHQVASAKTLLGLLNALGIDIAAQDDAARLLAERRQKAWSKPIEPVAVAWAGRPAKLRVRLPASMRTKGLILTIDVGGEKRRLRALPSELPLRTTKMIGGEEFDLREWALPSDLPTGAHALSLSAGAVRVKGKLLVAHEKCWQPEPAAGGEREWGIFLPLYALKTRRSWGGADWGDFRRLIEWTEARGGQVVAALPMLAGFLGNGPLGDEPGPFEYSPYAPVSRFFLNEFYIDLEAIPELEQCAAARALIASEEFQREIAELNAAPLVDYRRQMALKRRVLEILAAELWKGVRSTRRTEFMEWIVDDHSKYAQFRAYVEETGCSFHGWSRSRQKGMFRADDGGTIVFYHHYVQWIAHQQLQSLAERARRGGGGLYLDMPLGVAGDGYDVWRWPELFANGAGGGAPPDGFFSKGQNWGFPPIHPGKSREEGHAYLAAAYSAMMAHAGILRIDHVMGLHRLYWIPNGLAATEGAYVKYPAKELYAILSIESHRRKTRVIGENLGTVPPRVNAAMARHGLTGMHVMQFGFHANGERPFDAIPDGTVASVNTHDTATFGGWWHGADMDLQVEMGLITPEDRRAGEEWRSNVRPSILYFLRQRGLLKEGDDEAAALAGMMRWMASSRASLVLVNVEDLWLERAPQNVPGTGAERPNWRRRCAVTFEDWSGREDIEDLLGKIDAARRAPAHD